MHGHTFSQLHAGLGSGIEKIEDLKGKKVATPLGSTSHFSLMGALENAGIAASDVTVLGPGADRSGVFPRHALMPWLNVIDNVAFGLKLQGKPAGERRDIAATYLKLLGLEGFEKRPVYELSGGMQQRVGIARALTSDPEILLMDEPLGALDALSREKAQELILSIWRKTGKMVFFITHSVEEALFMGSKLVVMSPRPGRVTHTVDLDFCHRYFATGDARKVKASAEFIAMRERVLAIIFGDEMATEDEHA